MKMSNKVLQCSCSAIAGTEYWEHANGSGDLWYSGSASPKFYRWEITLSVTAQTHGSHLTRDDFQYNGLDVIVGDWVAGATDGKALKIISISSKTSLIPVQSRNSYSVSWTSLNV